MNGVQTLLSSVTTGIQAGVPPAPGLRQHALFWRGNCLPPPPPRGSRHLRTCDVGERLPAQFPRTSPVTSGLPHRLRVSGTERAPEAREAARQRRRAGNKRDSVTLEEKSVE